MVPRLSYAVLVSGTHDGAFHQGSGAQLVAFELKFPSLKPSPPSRLLLKKSSSESLV